MALIQFELNDEYTDALEHVARSNKTPRRQFMTDYMMDSLDKVPGLMKMIRDRRVNGIRLENEIAIPEFKSEILKEPEPEKVVTYRFHYLDPSRGYLEGRGATAGKALMDAMKIDEPYDANEYAKEFRVPERVG